MASAGFSNPFRVLWAVLPACVLFVGHAALYGSWVVDDAGISYAYARNLAEGHGWVAQSGQLPIEGFSNALWVLLLAATHLVGLFDPVWAPKILSGLLVLLTFYLLAASWLDDERRRTLSAGLALATTAVATPFVVWCVSGLENALSTCLVGALVAISLKPSRQGRWEAREASAVGLVCFLLFLTRPDGILYLGVPPLLMGLWNREDVRKATGALAASFFLPWMLWTSFRLAYFGDVFPNTYYAKRGPGWQEVGKLLERLGTWGGGLVFLAAVTALGIGGIVLAVRLGRRLQRLRSLSPALTVLAAYFLTAYVAFEALPTDWMPEYRFGTALFLLGPFLVLEILTAWRPKLAPVGAAALLLVSISYSARHSPDFRRAPTVPFDDVRNLSLALDGYADDLGIKRATVLLPDIGGSLWEDRFEVIDLAGLTDRTIGRTLRSDREAFLGYVRERRPDLVWVHGHWRELTRFEDVPWFTEQYVAVPPEILERALGVLWVRQVVGKGKMTGAPETL